MNNSINKTIYQPDLRAMIDAAGLRRDYVAAQLKASPQNLNYMLNTGRFLPWRRERFAALVGRPLLECFPHLEHDPAPEAA